MNSYNSGNWPPVTKNLIIINVLIWAVEFMFRSFAETGLIGRCGLHYIASDMFNPVQPITYLFLHEPSTPWHVFFNMFSLWMFGRLLENVWGSRRFLIFYFVCGIGAAAVQELTWTLTWRHEYISAIAQANGLTYDHMDSIVRQAAAAGNDQFLRAMAEVKSSMVTIGASGAVFGVLLGFAFVFPNMPLYLFFIPVPIKAKYMVLGYAVLGFFFGVSGSMSSVAHFAHLGGMIFGLIMLLYWKKKGTLRGGTFY